MKQSEYTGRAMNYHGNFEVSKEALSQEIGASAIFSTSKSSKLYDPVKRVFDFVLAASVAVLSLPFLLIVGLLIKSHDGGPAFFVQERIGKGGKTFKCFKFRTMVTDADKRLKDLLSSDPVAAEEWAKDQKLRNDPRITGVGRFLRKTSLDELPQLLNILKGEMSLVGPRPVVSNEALKYGSDFISYASCLPGVTGLWQISGRNDTTYAERVALDVKYANERSFFMDLKILVLTIPAVLFSSGAY